MSEPPRLKSTEYSVSMKRGSEMSELNAVGRINVYTRKGKGGGGKRGELFPTQRRDTARAESARPSNGGGQKCCRREAQRHITGCESASRLQRGRRRSPRGGAARARQSVRCAARRWRHCRRNKWVAFAVLRVGPARAALCASGSCFHAN